MGLNILFKLWRGKNLCQQAHDELRCMLEEDIKMFRYANQELFEGIKSPVNIYEIDNIVNEHEMKIRRKLLQHLSINPKPETTSSLILITITKDAERLGDYAKNILELVELNKGKLTGPNYVKRLKEFESRLMNIFELTKQAFFDDNEEKAKEVIELHNKISPELMEFIHEITKDKKLSAKKAVVRALLARYYRRTAAHLKNIARTVVNPFDRIKNNIKKR
jgi:phosphate uptake regulator